MGGIWVGLVAAAALPPASEEPPSGQHALASDGIEGVEGVLLLRNKNLLAGQIVRRGDRYHVVAPGAQFSVPAAQVWRCCRSAEDAYQFLRSTHRRLLARDHLRLAQWCLRNDLLTQAARELLDARTLQSDLPLLPTLERQLRQRLRLAAADETDHVEGDPRGQSPEASATPVRQDRPLLRESPATGLIDATREVRADFARRVQPMLIQSCASSGCHAPDGTEQFQLNRLALAGGGHAELTRRNLAAVLAELTAEKPEQSRLVEHARREHGTTTRRSTPLKRRQTILLLEWTRSALGIDPTPEPVANPEVASVPADVAVVPAGYESMTLDETVEPEIIPRDRWDPAIFHAEQ